MPPISEKLFDLFVLYVSSIRRTFQIRPYVIPLRPDPRMSSAPGRWREKSFLPSSRVVLNF
jgi:hypothetical protein